MQVQELTEIGNLKTRLFELSLKSQSNQLHTKDAGGETQQLIRDLYKKHNIELPTNPVFREITQPKCGAGFQRVVDCDKYKIYSKTILTSMYIKFYVKASENFAFY